MHVFHISQLTKVYGKRSTRYEALRGIDLQITQGESLAIVGKSGSGKSTLMHILAGLDHPTNGQVLFGDLSLAKMSEGQLAKVRNQSFGFIFQQFFLQPNMTVLENVALPLKIAGTSRSVRETAARKAIEAVGLEDKIKNKAVDLSGGQKQRVAIARAIVCKPDVIFADEPTGNLDSENGKLVAKLLFDLHKKEGMTLVLVTHDSDLAKLCDRVIHITDGKISKAK